MADHRTPPVQCPQCKALLDAAASMDEGNTEPPDEGDITVCIYCGAVLMWEFNMQLTLLTEEELEEIAKEYPDIIEAATVIKPKEH